LRNPGPEPKVPPEALSNAATLRPRGGKLPLGNTFPWSFRRFFFFGDNFSRKPRTCCGDDGRFQCCTFANPLQISRYRNFLAFPPGCVRPFFPFVPCRPLRHKTLRSEIWEQTKSHGLFPRSVRRNVGRPQPSWKLSSPRLSSSLFTQGSQSHVTPLFLSLPSFFGLSSVGGPRPRARCLPPDEDSSIYLALLTRRNLGPAGQLWNQVPVSRLPSLFFVETFFSFPHTLPSLDPSLEEVCLCACKSGLDRRAVCALSTFPLLESFPGPFFQTFPRHISFFSSPPENRFFSNDFPRFCTFFFFLFPFHEGCNLLPARYLADQASFFVFENFMGLYHQELHEHSLFLDSPTVTLFLFSSFGVFSVFKVVNSMVGAGVSILCFYFPFPSLPCQLVSLDVDAPFFRYRPLSRSKGLWIFR